MASFANSSMTSQPMASAAGREGLDAVSMRIRLLRDERRFQRRSPRMLWMR
jgi:hypothetical protein